MLCDLGLMFVLTLACFAVISTALALLVFNVTTHADGSYYITAICVNTWYRPSLQARPYLWVVIAILIVSYLAWRIRRFRASRNRPLEPQEYPYWFPVVGHTLSMMWNPQRLVDRARVYFGDTRKPFTISAMGHRFHFITNPKDVSEVYRKSNALTHDIFLSDLMTQFNISRTTRHFVFLQPDSSGRGPQLVTPNPSFKSLARLTVDMFREQLAPGPKLHRLGEITMASLEPLTRWATMKSQWYTIREEDDYRDISLLRWCQEVMLKTANRTFFGKALDRVAPKIMNHFLRFDELSYCALFQFPHCLSKLLGMTDAQDAMTADLFRYFNLPLVERSDRNWLIDQQEAEFINLGLDTKEIAKLVAMIFWVINTNAYKLLFWMVCNLLLDSILRQHVTAELRSCFDENGNLDVDALTGRDMSAMPFTNALWHETLRVTNSASSARYVATSTSVGGLHLRKGDRVIVPYRQLHYNSQVFGPSAFEFNFKQWLETDDLDRNPSYRPFGGGLWLCPGRFLAKQEICMAIAYLLYRYDVELTPFDCHGSSAQDKSQNFQQAMPRMDESSPGIGVVSAVKGDDYTIRLKKRDQD